jgi:transposase-like protein
MAKPRNGPQERAEALQRVKQGEFKTELAKEFGVSMATMYEWTKGVPQVGKKPSTHSLYRSAEDRRRAIQLITQGAKRKDVAKELGVSLSALNNWMHRSGVDMKNKPHSNDVRKEAIRRVLNGKSKIQVAHELNVASSVVKRWTKGTGKIKPSYTKEERLAVFSRVSKGEDKVALARELGISITTVHSWTKDIKRLKFLSKTVKEDAIRRAECGETKTAVARELGISISTIHKITPHVKRHLPLNSSIKEEFIERIKKGESPVPLARALNVQLKSYHQWRKAGTLDVPISSELMKGITKDLSDRKTIATIALDRRVPAHQVRQIKRGAEGRSTNVVKEYSAEYRLEAVRQVEAGETTRVVAKQRGVSYATVYLWIKDAVAARTIALPSVLTKADDHELKWITRRYPEAEDWRKPFAGWLAGESAGRQHKLTSVSNFVSRYLSLPNVPKTMADLLRRGTVLPNFYDELLKIQAPGSAIKQHNSIHSAINWILLHHFSEYDDDDNEPVIAPGFRNPFPYINRNGVIQNIRDESVRDVMPYGYILELRERLAEGPTFSDWKLAQSLTGFDTSRGNKNCQTDWFAVTEDRIDKNDPNCVWRLRTRLKKDPILEMWSPVRWVAVLIKLQTVARTGMVRMLDSGESDTWRYESNSFMKNGNLFAEMNEGQVWQQGVFRRNPVHDATQKAILYFNTNKTKDRARSGPDKGHVCPWPSFEAISDDPYYWLVLLRNWQEKYNPISKRTSWQEIPSSRSISIKSEIAKAGYPDACFLFRTPEEKGKYHLPVSNGVVDKAWRNLLKAFDEELAQKNVTHADGSPVQLYQVTEGRTKFPLHGLRVSIITSMTIEGNVPPELMMKIVGHSRLVMLLYYTKPGVTTMLDAIKDAAAELDRQKEASILQFLANATDENMQDRIAFNVEDWRTVVPVNPAHRNPVGWMLMHDGICFAGGNTSPLDGDNKVPGCHNGGPIRKASTSEYDPVPGGSMNCSRCRWFAAEKRHGPALIATFNNQSYHLRAAQETAFKWAAEITNIKKEKARIESSGAIFTRMSVLKAAERYYESAMAKLCDTAASLAETYKLAMRVKELPDVLGGGIALAAKGDLMTMNVVMEETDSELLQLSGICGDVELYPDLAPGTAIYRRSQIYDAALKRDGRPPFFMQLTEDEQLTYGNAFMKKLADMANPANPLLGLRTVVSSIDAGESLEDLLGIKFLELLPKLGDETTNIIKLAPRGFNDGKDRCASR